MSTPEIFRILLIDDDQSYTEPLERAFSQAPFQVKVCWNGESGLKEAQNGEYHLIFLDMMMPGIHGIETLKELKSNPQTSRIPILITSSLPAETYREEALKAGASGIIPKGTDLSEIMAAVQQVSGIVIL